MKIVYRLTNGIAADIRCERESYALKAGELSVPGDEIPTPQSLSDPAAWAAMQAEKSVIPMSGEDVLALLIKEGVISKAKVDAARAQKGKP